VLLDEDDVDHHEDGRDGENGKEKRADVVEGHKGSLEMRLIVPEMKKTTLCG
jgi:hypothetical protein